MQVPVDEARAELGPETPPQVPPTVPRTKWRGAILILAMLGAAVMGWISGVRQIPRSKAIAPAGLPHRFTMPMRTTPPSAQLAVSPDGTRVVFVDEDAAGQSHLFLRTFNEVAARPLNGTMGARDPFWSADGRTLAFSTRNDLRRMDVAGGAPVVLCQIDGPTHGGAWGQNGGVIFADRNGRLFTVQAGGGTPRLLWNDNRARYRPFWLPGDQRVLYSISRGDEGVYVATPGEPSERKILDRPTPVMFTEGGLLVFVGKGGLLARAFDLASETFSGPDTMVVADVVTRLVHADAGFSMSRNGVLVYQSNAHEPQEFVFADRAGRAERLPFEADTWHDFDLSWAADRIVASRINPESGGRDVWLLDLKRETRALLRSGGDASLGDPLFSPDGSEIVFHRHGKTVERQAVSSDASTEILRPTVGGISSEDWSADGRWLTVGELVDGGGKQAFLIDLKAPEDRIRFANNATHVDEMHFSPDGRWVAYHARIEDTYQVHVSPVPPDGQGWQVSTDGGVAARWHPGGKEIFYLAGDGTMMSASFAAGRPPMLGAPAPLFHTGLVSPDPTIEHYDLLPDGARFLIKRPVSGRLGNVLHVLFGSLADAPRP